MVCLLEIRKGGFIFYSDDQWDAVKQAHLKFQQANDKKAIAIMALVYTSSQPASKPQVLASGSVRSLICEIIVDLN
jgi:hypothetical protein